MRMLLMALSLDFPARAGEDGSVLLVTMSCQGGEKRHMDMTFAALSEVANNDHEFRIAARLWNTTLRLDMGGHSLRICIEQGQITKVIAADHPFSLLSPANLVVSAPAAEWQKFFAPIPKPFYVDIWGATTHHGFTVAGDMDSFYAYYPALRRLFDIMRGLAS